jgi:hypothetical protein
MRSTTSNTVGYRILQFSQGTNTLSLPLKPFSDIGVDVLMSNIGADSISMLDSSDDWQTYTSISNGPLAEMGEGYVVEFSAPSIHVFTGEPASMIMHQEGFGFDGTTRDDMSASVGANWDVTVSWPSVPGADRYRVLRSSERDGFHTGNYTSIDVISAPFVDVGAASAAGELYYMVVPNSDVEGDGSSTYSIGIFTAEYNGNEMIGLPLKSTWGEKSADWYVDQIPNCLGLVFFEDSIWKAHFKEFPEGVYDTTIEAGKGYEISVYATSLFSFIGW